MQVPKQLDFIPMDNPGVADAIKDALDDAEELRDMLRENVCRHVESEAEARKQLKELKGKVD